MSSTLPAGQYLAQTLRAAGVTAAVTNLAPGDYGEQDSDGNIAPFTILALPHANRTLAFLALVDPTHLAVLNPFYAKRFIRYRRAVSVAMGQLDRIPAHERPTVVVLSVPSVPVTQAEMNKHGTATAAMLSLVKALAEEVDGLDVILVNGFELEPEDAFTVRSWHGDGKDVLILPTGKPQGLHISVATLPFIAPPPTTDTADGDPCRRTMTLGEWEAATVALDSAEESESMIHRLLIEHERSSMLAHATYTFGTLPKDATMRFDGAELQPGGVCNAHNEPTTKVIIVNSTDGIGTAAVCGCRVSECGAGRLIADAMQWASNADISFVNAGSIRSSLLPGANVTRALIREVLPFDAELLLFNITGVQLLAALANAIRVFDADDVSNDPGGRLLQISSTMRVRWSYNRRRATLISVLVQQPIESVQTTDNETSAAPSFEPVQLDAVYSVATTKYVFQGGDEYTMFMPATTTATPVSTLHEAVGSYIEAMLATKTPWPATNLTAAGGLQQAAKAGRFMQLPDVSVVEVGLLCNAGLQGEGNSGAREECDHIHHAIELINNKNDGWMDDLLPTTQIVVTERRVSCNNAGNSLYQGAEGVAKELKDVLPNVRLVFGPSCSGDLKDVANSTSRAISGLHVPFVSWSSTVDALNDEVLYPNVLRLATSDR